MNSIPSFSSLCEFELLVLIRAALDERPVLLVVFDRILVRAKGFGMCRSRKVRLDERVIRNKMTRVAEGYNRKIR